MTVNKKPPGGTEGQGDAKVIRHRGNDDVRVRAALRVVQSRRAGDDEDDAILGIAASGRRYRTPGTKRYVGHETGVVFIVVPVPAVRLSFTARPSPCHANCVRVANL